jgi:glycine oxidase
MESPSPRSSAPGRPRVAIVGGGVMALLEGAWRALPGIEELPLDEMWVGFRPGSRDDAPILGGTDVTGLIVAAGHHRNGILLTPVTADAIGEFILTGTLPDAIRPFGIDRFRARLDAHEREASA